MIDPEQPLGEARERPRSPAGLNAAFAAGDLFAALFEALDGEGVRRVLDIGCGRGAFCAHLAGRGLSVVGIDPQDEALAAARAAASGASFVEGRAEALPFPDASFDAAVFVNALHHVPEPDMDAAIAQAGRVVRPGGPILIAEPLAEGPHFTVLQLVEDETLVRAAAARAVDRAVASGRFALRGNVVFDRRERFRDAEDFLARILAADPNRARAVEELRDALSLGFEAHGTKEDDATVLVQPQRLYWLRAAPASETGR